MHLNHDAFGGNDLDLVQPIARSALEFDTGDVPGDGLADRCDDGPKRYHRLLHLTLAGQIMIATAIIGLLARRRSQAGRKCKANDNENGSQERRKWTAHGRSMADRTCRNNNKPGQLIDRRKRLVKSRHRAMALAAEMETWS